MLEAGIGLHSDELPPALRLARDDGQRCVEDALAPLKRLGRADQGGEVLAGDPVAPAERLQEPPRRAPDDPAAAGVGMLHEAAADLVVAEAGGEQQPRSLDPAGREHEGLGPDGQPGAAQRARLDPRDSAVRRHDPGHRRVGRDLALRVGLEVGAALPGEAVESAVEGPERRLQILEAGQLHAGPAQILGLRPTLRQPEQRPRLPVPAFELLPADRPARKRHIVALLEIDRVELSAAPAPDGGGAAEEAKPAVLEVVIILADIVAGIEVGRRRLIVEPAALQKHDTVAEREQASSQADPRRPRPDHADLAFELERPGNLREVDHGSSFPRKRESMQTPNGFPLSRE